MPLLGLNKEDPKTYYYGELETTVQPLAYRLSLI